MDHDTIENLQRKLNSGVCEVSQKIPLAWKEKQDAKLSTLATDGPNILTIQEPLVSSISYTRMYPEQMLWACTETRKREEEEQTVWRKMIEHDHTFSTYTYCNFNQFTQRNLSDAYQNLPDVVPSPRTISTQDFLIPMNLLSSRKSPDRIYGFYYLVN